MKHPTSRLTGVTMMMLLGAGAAAMNAGGKANQAALDNAAKIGGRTELNNIIEHGAGGS